MAYAELNEARDRIEVTTRYEERELIKAIPGSRYHPQDKIWSIPLTWPACVQLRGLFKNELHLGPEVIRWATHEREYRVDSVMRIRTLLEPLARLDTRLYPFQETGQDFMILASSALLGDEMGTGKTIQALTTIERQNSSKLMPALPGLVICPNSTKFNWLDETMKWLPDANPLVVTGGAVERKKVLKRTDDKSLVIINIEAVRIHSRLAPYGSVHLTDAEREPKELNGIPFRTVTFDEAHRMKDPKSKQTRAAWAVAHQDTVHHRYALTGTPIANDPSDLWSILHFLAPDEFPTRSKFIDRYCLQAWNSYGGLSVIGIQPETREEFQAVIGPRFRRVTKGEVLQQLPKKQRQLIAVDMAPKQRKAYNDMESTLATRTPNGIVVASTNLSAQIRLLQFAGSMCDVDEEGMVTPIEPSPKLDALMDVIDAAQGKPLVVCAVQRKLIELAAKRLDKAKIPYGLITGKIGEWDRKENLRKFQEGLLPLLLFTVQAGGTGLNMTRADTIVFLQRSWSMVDNKQAEDRVHRIGSEIHESINVIDIVTLGTVEQTVITRYVEKVNRLDQITQDRARARATGVGATELDELEAFILNSHLGDL